MNLVRVALGGAVALAVCAAGTLLLGGPGAAAATSVTLGFTGDTGGNANTAAVGDAARNAGVAAFFNLGDMSYSQIAPEANWCSFMAQHTGSTMAYQLVAGNHEDQDGPDGLWSNFASCMPDKLGSTGAYPRQYYADYPADNPLVRLIMVSPKLTFNEGSSYWSYKSGTQGYTFTSNAIDGARSANIPFVVVGMHMYCLSMVDYPCAASPDLMNLLVKKKVDLYLQAHDHGYARSKQLALNGTCTSIALGSFNPDCVASADPGSSYVAGAGTVLATVGPGGRSLNKENPNNPQAPYFQTYMGTNNNPTYGFLKIDVSSSQMTGTFVRGAGGTYTDTFTIARTTPSPTPSPTDTTSPTPTPTPTDTTSPTPTPTPTDTTSPSPTATSTPGTVRLTPVADTWVGDDLPATNHGKDTALYVDASPSKVSYLKFDLSGLAGKSVTSAQLEVTTTTGTSSGSPNTQNVRSVADTAWSELGMTYNTRPPTGAVLGSIAGTTFGTTYQIQLPASAVQASVGGLYSLAIDSPGSDAWYVNSRETTQPTRLVVTTSN